MNSNNELQRLSQLVALLCDDLIDEEQFKELDQILQHSQQARRWYHVYIGLHHDLESQQLSDLGITEDSANDKLERPRPQQKRVKDNHRRLPKSPLIFAASILILIVSSMLYETRQPVEVANDPVNVVKTPEPVATITYAAEVQWESNQLDVNSPVLPSRIRLKSGLIRLTYRHGVVLSLKGPADFEIRSMSHSVLHRGQVAAYVPTGAEGFRVDSPNAKVVDLGTEFGITVNDRGESQVSVFDGKVELTPSTEHAEPRIVSSGNGYYIAEQGEVIRLFELAPYKEARDALRGWQTVWEPFGPGSPAGLYPGSIAAGWQSPWVAEVTQGILMKKRTGIFNRQPLHPGTEFYLSLRSRVRREDKNVRALMSRAFGSIDQFTTSKPYTIELLIRLESKQEDLERLSVFSKPDSAEKNDANSWQLDLQRASLNEELTWKLPRREIDGHELVNRSLPVRPWATYRCFVEVEPELNIWRGAIANQEDSISNNFGDAIPLTNSVDGVMRLGFEVVGKNGKPVSFSVDAIRIQNRPDGK